MAPRATASERMRRVLAVVPWIVANPGQLVSEVAARFEIKESQLLDDLGVVWMVGLPPYSPDALIDVQIDEGRVFIHLADYFARPFRLTPAQGLALLASSDALLSVPGTDPNGALARALGKLAAVLGPGAQEALDVHLGDAEEDIVERLRAAASEGLEVELLYYSYGRDEKAVRRVAPWHLFSQSGAWYLHGWCHRAQQERVFRLDRIEELTVTDTISDRPAPAVSTHNSIYQARPEDPRVVLKLSPDASWVADTYSCEVLEETEGGSKTIVLAVSQTPWLERLLIRLGSQVQVVEGQGVDALEVRKLAAGRILNRYRTGG